MDLSTLRSAADRIRPYVQKTPLIRCYPLERARLFLKCEHLQATGSFKVRAAFNAMLTLSEAERRAGVVTRSAGNFAQAVAYAGARLGISATIVLPADVPSVKKEGVEKYRAKAILQAGGRRKEEQRAEDIARDENRTLLSPFNMFPVIESAGSIGLEIHEQLPSIRAYFGQVSGGGMMAGSSCALKRLDPTIQTIAVEPIGANDYCLSRQKGSPVTLDSTSTIADGLRAPRVGTNTWPLLQKYVDDAVAVEDSEIIAAMKLLYQKMGIIVEPSGATSLAAAIRWSETHREDAACVLTGANVDRETFFAWMEA